VGYALGVDLGTAFTAAAVSRDGRVQIADLGNRAASIPSVVFLREDETILTGEAASRRGLSEPDRVAREFKRRVGDPTPLFVGATPYSAEALMAKLLRWVVAAVSEREGGPPDAVAVCHPANWGPYKTDLIDQAVRLADLPSATLLTEPEAAAIHYASQERVDPGQVVAVFDLGGGTFDAAVLRKTDGEWEILGEPEGIERLGGVDFDAAIYAHVVRSLEGRIEALDPNDSTNQAAVARLKQECVAAKEALSSDTDASIPVFLPNAPASEIRLTRTEFEAMIRPALADAIHALQRALRSAQLEPSDVSTILLVGGSSRIPLVSQLVSAEFGRPVAVDAHPKHAIALGAAIAATAAASGQSVDNTQVHHIEDLAGEGVAAAAAATAAAVVAEGDDGGAPPTAPLPPPAAPPAPSVEPGTAPLPPPVPVAPIPPADVSQPPPAAPGPEPEPEPEPETEPAPIASTPPAAAGGPPSGPPPGPPPGAPPPGAPTPAAPIHAEVPAAAAARFTPAGTGGSLPPGSTIVGPGEGEAPPPGKKGGRGFLIAALVIIGLVLVGAGVVYALTSSGGDDGGEVATGDTSGDTTGDTTEDTTEKTTPEETTTAVTANPEFPFCNHGTQICIDDIFWDGDTLVAMYVTDIPLDLPNGQHAHFYLSDETTEETSGTQAGDDQGSWRIWESEPEFSDRVKVEGDDNDPLGGFTRQSVEDEGATKLCVNLADNQHSTELSQGSGYCVPIPET
jgi:actin-like ATPase involved in cell morphogenesis